ncbi:phage tail tape measure protein [Massilimicrobiota sp. An80]|uniref:phage tail tape measure protein n=1 Tax=Massilimicrobiota sp. An80 TaxID=1965658 RepID=UPI000B43F075|nr:phage tail tape measure protein [Massilimicrobiota sp. An80]OUN38285.1 phage tail tape measure protein [Massilimicrobiota sp. An80]
MASNVDGTLKFDTKIDESGFNDGTQSIGNSAKKGMSIVTKAFAAGTAAISAGGLAVIKMGSDFEAQMSRVKAISGATQEDFQKLRDQALQLGADTSFSASQAAEGMENLAAAGFSVTETMEAMPGLLDLAAASGEDLSASSDIAASAIRGFGLKASEAAHVADVLAANANMTNSSVAQTGEALKYIAPVARAAGISLEETSAAIGLMANAGIQGSQAGTTLRGALSRLSKPTDDMCQVMDQLGLEFYDSEGKMKSLHDQIEMLQKATKGMTDEQRNNALVTLYGQESLSGMLALINEGPDSLDKLTKSFQECDGIAKETAATMQDNFQGAFEQMTGSLETLAIRLYDSVSEPLKNLAVLGTDAINQLTTGLQTNGVAGMAMAGANIVGSLISSFLTQAPLLLSQGMTMVAQLSQGLVQGIPNLISSALTMIQTFATNLANQAPVIIQKGFEMLSNLVQGILNALPVMIQQLPQIITTFANIINDNFPTILMKGAELLLQFIKGILSAIPTLIANIPQIIQAIISVILAYNWLNLGKQIIQFFGNGISKMVSFVSSKAGGIFNTVVNALKNLPQTLMNLAKNMISKFGKSITNATGTVKGAVKGVFNAIINGFKSLPSQMASIGTNLVKGLWNGIGNVKDWILGKIKGFGSSILNGIKSFFGIKSPSKVFADEVGKFMPMGIEVGFANQLPKSFNLIDKQLGTELNDLKGVAMDYSFSKPASTVSTSTTYNTYSNDDPIDYERIGNETANAIKKSNLSVSINRRKVGRLVEEEIK